MILASIAASPINADTSGIVGAPVRDAYAPSNNTGVSVRDAYAPSNNTGVSVKDVYAPSNNTGLSVKSFQDETPPVVATVPGIHSSREPFHTSACPFVGASAATLRRSPMSFAFRSNP